MLLSEEEVAKRLNSPMNLLNRMKGENSGSPRNSAMSLFGLGSFKNNPASSRVENKSEQIKEEKISQEEKEPSIIPFINPFIKEERTESVSLIPLAQQLAEVTKPTEHKLEEVKKDDKSPSLESLIDDSDSKIKLATLHNTALDTLNAAMNRLSTNIDRIDPTKLPPVITATSKIVESIRKERIELDKGGRDKNVHYHFYTPTQKREEDYEIIDVAPTKEAQGAR